MKKNIFIFCPASSIFSRTDLVKLVEVALSLNFNVEYFGWERLPGELDKHRYNLTRVIEKALITGGGHGVKSRIFYILWTVNVLIKVLSLPRSSTVWAVGWETAFPALLASYFRGIKVIFADTDRFSMIIKMPILIKKIVQMLERVTSNKVHLHVIPGPDRYDWFNSNMYVLRNSPSQNSIDEAMNYTILRPKSDVVLYANGWIGKTRGSRVILETIEALKKKGVSVHLIVAGRVDDDFGRQLIIHKDVSFYGEVCQAKALSFYRVSDYVFTLYDPSIEINRYAESSKWGDAVHFGVTIIVNKEVSTSKFLVDNNAALVFPYESPEILVNLIASESINDFSSSERRRNILKLKEAWPTYDIGLRRIFRDFIQI